MTFTSITISALTLMSSIGAGDFSRELDTVNAVVATCESPVDFDGSSRHAMLQGDDSELLVEQLDTGLIKLVQLGEAYDLWFVNAAGKRVWSARNSGANITDLQLDSEARHLVLSRDNGEVEHFLFNLRLDGSGELIWSSPEYSAMTSCSV